ncbi:MAG: prolyl 4-hydroxylase [Monoraphidium minutum]|nr:MAG: prolyl 4-hydroxylase [Monoraphidium minutum]
MIRRLLPPALARAGAALGGAGAAGRAAFSAASPPGPQQSPPQQPLSWSQLMQAAVTPAVAQHLQAKGYAVVDGALPPAAAAALRAEIDALRSAPGLMRPNCTHLVTGGGAPELLPKAQITEAEITLDAAAAAAAPLLAAADADGSLAVLLSLFLPRLRLGGQATKAQFNAGGGGAFPIHTDTEEELDGHGGELRLYPFPAAPPVDVAPLDGRMVLFSVLPSHAPRYCFTAWLSQAAGRGPQRAPPRPAPPPPPPAGAHPEAAASARAAALRFLLHPAMRRHVVKLAYSNEWAASLAESHPPCGATDAALAQHAAGTGAAARALAPYASEIAALADACAAGRGEEALAAAGLPGPAVEWF